MNMKLKSSLIAACAALTLGGGVVHANADHGPAMGKSAQTQRQGHRHAVRSPLMSTLKQLDLTAEQRQSVRAVFDTNAPQRKSLWEQQRANRAALAAVTPDDPKYPELIAQRKQLAAASIQQASYTESQIYALLTPEQKAKVPQILAERKARWEQRRQDRQGKTT